MESGGAAGELQPHIGKYECGGHVNHGGDGVEVRFRGDPRLLVRFAGRVFWLVDSFLGTIPSSSAPKS
jgi:hypothetical protein